MTSATAVPYRTDARTLARASAAAALAGAVILALFVLPAEYGIDPTGVGGALGLTALNGEADDGDTMPPPIPGQGLGAQAKVPEQTRDSIIRTTPYRADERTLTLAPHSGAEIKAEMQAGDQFVFAWTASAPIKMDMHGETSLSATEFSTYWKQKGLRQAQGSFTAPFAGIHGWYWRNGGEVPVTVTLRTSGFYRKLIRPPVE